MKSRSFSLIGRTACAAVFIAVSGITTWGVPLVINGPFLGEDQNANGVLDPGEDVNGNGFLDMFKIIGNGSVVGGGGAGQTFNIAGSVTARSSPDADILDWEGTLEALENNVTKQFTVSYTFREGPKPDLIASLSLDAFFAQGFYGPGSYARVWGTGTVDGLQFGHVGVEIVENVGGQVVTRYTDQGQARISGNDLPHTVVLTLDVFIKKAGDKIVFPGSIEGDLHGVPDSSSLLIDALVLSGLPLLVGLLRKHQAPQTN